MLLASWEVIWCSRLLSGCLDVNVYGKIPARSQQKVLQWFCSLQLINQIVNAPKHEYESNRIRWKNCTRSQMNKRPLSLWYEPAAFIYLNIRIIPKWYQRPLSFGVSKFIIRADFLMSNQRLLAVTHTCRQAMLKWEMKNNNHGTYCKRRRGRLTTGLCKSIKDHTRFNNTCHSVVGLIPRWL